MTMVIIEPPLAPWRLRLCPSPQLSNGLLCFPICCTKTVSPGFRSTGDGRPPETSRSFTLTISCQKICSSNLGELFPIHFIKTALAGFVAILHFTSPRTMLWLSPAAAGSPTTAFGCSSCNSSPYHGRIVSVSYPCHQRTYVCVRNGYA